MGRFRPALRRYSVPVANGDSGVLQTANGERRPSTARQTLFQAVRYAFYSMSAAVIEFLVENLLEWGFRHFGGMAVAPYWPCYLTALVISVIWNFTINRNFNFNSVVDVRVGMAKILVYYVFFTPLSTWWGHILTSAGWNHNVVLIGTILLNGVTEFMVYRYAVFGKTMNTNRRAQRQAASG